MRVVDEEKRIRQQADLKREEQKYENIIEYRAKRILEKLAKVEEEKRKADSRCDMLNEG